MRNLEVAHWQKIKRQRAQIVGLRCEAWGCPNDWDDGHHEVKRDGWATVDDIRLYCRRHHDDVHAKRRIMEGQDSFDGDAQYHGGHNAP